MTLWDCVNHCHHKKQAVKGRNSHKQFTHDTTLAVLIVDCTIGMCIIQFDMTISETISFHCLHTLLQDQVTGVQNLHAHAHTEVLVSNMIWNQGNAPVTHVQGAQDQWKMVWSGWKMPLRGVKRSNKQDLKQKKTQDNPWQQKCPASWPSIMRFMNSSWLVDRQEGEKRLFGLLICCHVWGKQRWGSASLKMPWWEMRAFS